MNNPFRSVWFQCLNRLVLAFFMVFCSVSVSAQTYAYHAFVKNDKVGEVKVVREVNDEAEKISIKGFYRFDSDSIMLIQFNSKSTYMDGMLKEAESTTAVNGQGETSVLIWQEDEHYVIRKSGLDMAIPILVEELFGLDLFFFEEPKTIRHAYSTFTGEKYWIQSTHGPLYQIKRIN